MSTVKVCINPQWKLTLPVEGEPGKPKEVYSPFKEVPGCFEILDNNVLRMSAAVDGFHTKGSSYPRSEFRELNASGGLAGWDPRTEVCEMKWTAAVDELPPKKSQVVVGQIHDAEDDVIEIRHSSAKLIEIIHDTTHFGILDSDYTLGEVYNNSIKVENNNITVTYEKPGKPPVSIVIKNFVATPCYFKIGCYTQSNTTKEPTKSGRASVRLFSSSVIHGSTFDKTPGVPIPTPTPTPDVPKPDKPKEDKPSSSKDDKKDKDKKSDKHKKKEAEKKKKESEKKKKEKKKEKDSDDSDDSDDDKKKKKKN
jgi:hypothetical protein